MSGIICDLPKKSGGSPDDFRQDNIAGSHGNYLINFFSPFLQSNRTCPICRGDAASFFNGMPGGNASPPLTASTASN